MQVSLASIRDALNTIHRFMPASVSESSLYFIERGKQVTLKQECNNYTKSFKIRGAINMIANLDEAQRRAGVITVSSGNHGAGVSFACRLLGLETPPTIVVPETTPDPKVNRIKLYGGNVIKAGKNYDEANQYAQALINSCQLSYVDPCSDPFVIAGQGTIALELMKTSPELDAVVVPIGGGGMASGVAMAYKEMCPKVKVFGIQTRACPAMVKSLADGVCYEVFPNEPSICDALVGGVGELPYHLVSKYVDDIFTVEEGDIAEAVRIIFEEEKIIAEPAGAAAYAAVAGDYLPDFCRNIAVVISGGNITTDLLKSLIC